MNEPRGTCSSCLFWSAPRGAFEQYAHRTIGTCSKGGPDPDQGCSDTAAGETCEKYQHDAGRR